MSAESDLRPAPSRGRPEPSGPSSALSAPPRVTAILCTLGRHPRLRDAVTALRRQRDVDLEVVVVDNDPASGRTTAALAGLDEEPGAPLWVVAAERRGLSAARNVGLAAATGDLVAFTDDDALPAPDWAATVVALFDDAPESSRLSCVTGRVVPGSLETPWERLFEEAGGFDKGGEPLAWSLAPDGPSAALGRPGPRGVLYPYGGTEFGAGNNMVFLRARLDDLGGFDEDLGAGTPTRGGEDLDVFRRVLLAGDTLAYSPGAVVHHFHRDSADALRDQMYGYGTGMAAAMTKILTSDGRASWHLARHLARVGWVVFSRRSPKNVGKSDGYPGWLTRAELAGYLAGPWLLLRTRRSRRR
ncbi:glycosyltransferase family 2 protein [Actinomycetospora flava]|uniref:Glycosyltransferase n=1 Tax=Actinomycetospora flava TaxID=3129232 RepID=A0ABU8MAB9_9PSEU